MDWKKELAQYITGEVKSYDSATFYLENKDFTQTGYNILGQYQGVDYKYYVWVQVFVPEGYSYTEVYQLVAVLISGHSSEFPDVYIKQPWNGGLLFATDSDPSPFCENIKGLAETAPKPSPVSETTIKVLICVVVGVLLLALLLIIKKKGGRK